MIIMIEGLNDWAINLEKWWHDFESCHHKSYQKKDMRQLKNHANH